MNDVEQRKEAKERRDEKKRNDNAVSNLWRFLRGGIPMPYVNIKITKEGNVTKEQQQALIDGATRLLEDVLGKNRKSIFVIIDEVETDNWGIAGDQVTEIRKRK